MKRLPKKFQGCASAHDRDPASPLDVVVLKLCRPDRGSDLMIAGYIVGLQGKQRPRKEPP